jgi:HTH-type transcriptional regulator/antitoxin HigA
MLLDGEIPVIGLTLRHDRLDNFWFTLLHEVGHILCHRDRGLRDGFFDEEGVTAQDELESEADTFAESALIPGEVWQRSFVRFTKTPTQVLQFARERGIGSAIVAGRIRRDRDDWTLFNDLIGRNSLRKLMASAGYWED